MDIIMYGTKLCYAYFRALSSGSYPMSDVLQVGVVTINDAVVSDRPVPVCLSAPKRLKVRTSNLAGVFPLPGTVPTWPMTNISEKWACSRSRDPLNFGALSANSSKTAEGTYFKFGRRVPRDRPTPDMTPDKCFRKVGVVTVTWPCKFMGVKC